MRTLIVMKLDIVHRVEGFFERSHGAAGATLADSNGLFGRCHVENRMKVVEEEKEEGKRENNGKSRRFNMWILFE